MAEITLKGPVRLRRGTTAERLAKTPEEGEIVYDTTLKACYIGDGSTAGGIAITALGSTIGKHDVYIAAGSMTPSASGGCAALATIASAGNQPDIQTLNFDAASKEYAQFSIRMPRSWNEGTITFVPAWSHAATTTNFAVQWELQAVAVSNDDTIAVNYGTEQASLDTGGTTNDLYIGPESSAITVAGTPQAGDMVFFRVARHISGVTGNMAIDARLHGITIIMDTTAGVDA